MHISIKHPVLFSLPTRPSIIDSPVMHKHPKTKIQIHPVPQTSDPVPPIKLQPAHTFHPVNPLTNLNNIKSASKWFQRSNPHPKQTNTKLVIECNIEIRFERIG